MHAIRTRTPRSVVSLFRRGTHIKGRGVFHVPLHDLEDAHGEILSQLVQASTYHAEQCVLYLRVAMYQSQLVEVMRNHRRVRRVHVPP